MMRTRWIVFNPALNWIQGDIEGETPQGAAKSVERHLSEATPNHVWEVYQAPSSFPVAGAGYSGGDVRLHECLRSERVHRIENNRYEEQLAMAC